MRGEREGDYPSLSERSYSVRHDDAGGITGASEVAFGAVAAGQDVLFWLLKDLV